ncbi:MAG: hypothetical protein ACTS3R_09470 [Inquilinaceae bacterium]
MSEVVVLYEDDPARAALGDHVRVVSELSGEWQGLMVTDIMLQMKNHDLPQQIRRIGMTFGEGVVQARQLAKQYGISTVFAVNRT